MTIELQPEFPHRTRKKERFPLTAAARSARLLPGPDGSERPRCRTSSCTRTRRTRSSTAPRCRRSWPCRAAELGYPALALTDHDGVYGSLEFAHAAKHFGVRPITGAELTLADRSHVTVLVETATGLREPLPADHRRARAHAAGRKGVAAAGRSRPRPEAAGGAERGARLPVRLRAPRPRGAQPERRCAARTGVRQRTLLRRAAASVRARRRAPERAAARPRLVARRPDDRHGRRARAQSAPRDAAGRPRRRPPPQLARRLRGASGVATTRASCSHRPEMVERFPEDRAAVARTVELAERLRFDLTEELGYRYPDFSDSPEPAIVQLAHVCKRAFEERYPTGHKLRREARSTARRGAEADRRARARRLLPAALGRARARARMRARGARARLAATLTAAWTRARLFRRLARLLPHRPLARRPGRRRALARPLPEPRARLRSGHRPRLSARHSREADRRRHRALRARARGARRIVLDVPLARRDPRRRQGARPSLRGARADRARLGRLEREARRRGAAAASRRRPQAALAALARLR